MINENEFKHYDFPLSATLLALGFPIKRLDREPYQKRAKFVFADTPELQEVISDFWADRLRISPQSLFNAQKNLKNRLYSSDI